MQKTKFDTVKELKPVWHLIDAKDQVLGRLAQQVAGLLNGKTSAHFSPNQYSQAKVVVINSDKIVVTGKKLDDKQYIWHTGFPKGLRFQSLKDAMAKDSTRVIERAVKGMLPKNRLQKKKMAGLFVFKDENHTHQANFGKADK
jgi:large subunit ribosomal protein L13